MNSLARRISDGRMLGLIKAWLTVPIEEVDDNGGKRLTNRARNQRKGTPQAQGGLISPLLSNIYMRRFILSWKQLGYALRFRAEIVNYADDVVILGKSAADEMYAAVAYLMHRLKLPINARKSGCLRCPEEPFTFLGYRIGRNYRPQGLGAYIWHPPEQGQRPKRVPLRSAIRPLPGTAGWIGSK